MSFTETPEGVITAKKMDADNARLALQLATRIPLMIRVSLSHLLSLSEESRYWDLRQALTIRVVRSILTPPQSELSSISKTQKMLSKEPGVKGRIWVATYSCPTDSESGNGIREVIAAAIQGLRDSRDPVCPETVSPKDLPLPAETVEAEWTGYRAEAARDEKPPAGMLEKEKYDEMMKEVSTRTTVLYFHGGAYWLMDPATHRPVVKKLAKLTQGRCYSVRYRLAPQHAFPAALMDGLVSYLGLLYPPEGAFHEPVRAEDIVFAGDSAGGNLALSLLQLLLFVQRHNLSIFWHGQERTSIPLPAGVAVNSPWGDITHSSPSCETNARFDYLPALHNNHETDAARPPCAQWPANPPRRSLFVDDCYAAHPLVTLVLADSWAGAPPVYICTGWELLADEDKFLAAKMARDGVPVTFEEYEGMPHCFAMVFPKAAGARRCMVGWAGFIRKVTGTYHDPYEAPPLPGQEEQQQDDVRKVRKMETSFTMIKAKTLEDVDLGTDGVNPYTQEEIRERIYTRVREAREGRGPREEDGPAGEAVVVAKL
ncbi:alpha/beta hydrolase fold-domain-containing protein [Apodospora peruviana]|uniref:Alpha/beta hydrolase fold-domain-containing protein n=1 Tax=Apodospora peruviana TaxID=516989 RepID=A0AAE0M1Y3_9PEZI|nr:alpha/beta hydrolase fold-domain-containing protein [Apodospora peruviana]